MEDFSSLIWLGIAIVWFLAKVIRGATKKTAGNQQKQARPTVSRPTVSRAEAPRTRIESPPGLTGRGGKGPPPIVPR